MLMCSWLVLCFLSHGFQVGVYTHPPVRTYILPINTSTVINYNTITMTIVTTSNYNKGDNIYVKKHVTIWDPRMSIVTLQTNIVLA